MTSSIYSIYIIDIIKGVESPPFWGHKNKTYPISINIKVNRPTFWRSYKVRDLQYHYNMKNVQVTHISIIKSEGPSHLKTSNMLCYSGR